MNIGVFFRKVYTVAYRLTGDEEISEAIATQAIINTIKELTEDYIVSANMFQLTILELVKIFLKTPNSNNNNLNGIQMSLLKLKPVNRAVIIWKDVLGYQISDNTPVINCNKEELLKELTYGRKELKEHYHAS